MKVEKVKVGILSFAHMHASSYANALLELSDVALTGVWDEDKERAATMAKRYETKTFDTPEALLESSLDGVIVCSENIHHRSLVELAAPRVPHILCEKPLATTLEDARAMIETCERERAKLMTAFPVRFAPPVQRLKALLDEGALGPVISVNATNHGRMPGGWFLDAKLAGGGAVLDHSVHVTDLLRWFWGTEFTEVYAEIGCGLLHEDVTIDDAGLLSFALANGAYGTLDTSWSRPPNYPTWGDVKLEIVGENGIARVDAFRQHLTLTSNREADQKADGGATRYVGWGSNADLGLVKSFVGMIREGYDPPISGEDGLRALQVALAAYRSAETNAPVTLSRREDVT